MAAAPLTPELKLLLAAMAVLLLVSAVLLVRPGPTRRPLRLLGFVDPAAPSPQPSPKPRPH